MFYNQTPINCMAFSHDNNYFAIGCFDGTATLYGVNILKKDTFMQRVLIHNQNNFVNGIVSSLCFSTNNKYFAVCNERALAIYSIVSDLSDLSYDKLTKFGSVIFKKESVNRVVFSNDCKLIAIGWNYRFEVNRKNNYHILFYNMSTSEEFSLNKIIIENRCHIKSLCFSHNNSFFATCEEDQIFIWKTNKIYEYSSTTNNTTNSNISSNQLILNYQFFQSVENITFSPNNEYLAVSSGKDVYLFGINPLLSINYLRIIFVLNDHKFVINSICFSCDCKYFATCSDDETSIIYTVNKDKINEKFNKKKVFDFNEIRGGHRGKNINDYNEYHYADSNNYLSSVCFSDDYFAIGSKSEKAVLII